MDECDLDVAVSVGAPLDEGQGGEDRSASAKCSPAALGGCGVRDIGPGVLPVKARSLSSLLAAGPVTVTSSQRLPEPKAAKNRLHLDLYPTSGDTQLPMHQRIEIVEATVPELVDLGATG